MSDFISGFFSWGKSKKVEEPKEEIEEVVVKEKLFEIPKIKESSDENE